MNIQNFRIQKNLKRKTPEISKRHGKGGVNAYDRAEVNKHNHFLLRSFDPWPQLLRLIHFLYGPPLC